MHRCNSYFFLEFPSFLSPLNSNLANYSLKSDIVNNLTSTSTDKPLSAAQGKALNDSLATYFYRGMLLNSANCEIKGYGSASILFLPNKKVKIDFSLKITDATTVESFSYGINRDFLINLCGKIITPVSGGNCLFLNSSGVMEGLSGLGGSFDAIDQFWTPNRIYLIDDVTNGVTGTWAANAFTAGTYIMGTVYGTY